MNKILIVQHQFPWYRNFLWRGLEKNFSLFFCQIKTVKKFMNFLITSETTFDCILLSGGLRDAPIALAAKVICPRARLIALTQALGRRRSRQMRWLRRNYLEHMFDRVVLYYEYELEVLGVREGGSRKFTYLNNTIPNIDVISQPVSGVRGVFFSGRPTAKSQFKLLLQIADLLPDITFHCVGPAPDCACPRPNVVRYGDVTDNRKLIKIAKHCGVALYPGDCGLSIVQYSKLGLRSIIHGDKSRHMPEVQAVSNVLPVFVFERGKARSAAEQILSVLNECKKADLRIKEVADIVFCETIAIRNLTKALQV